MLIYTFSLLFLFFYSFFPSHAGGMGDFGSRQKKLKRLLKTQGEKEAKAALEKGFTTLGLTHARIPHYDSMMDPNCKQTATPQFRSFVTRVRGGEGKGRRREREGKEKIV